MPVIPLDTKGAPDPNETKSIQDLIAEAEKNRPDVAQDQIGMQIARENLKAINNSLLPSLNAYGSFSGTGLGGPLNPNCNQNEGPGYCSSTLPSGTPGVLKDAFNYSAPEYQVGFTLISRFATARPRPISSALSSRFAKARSPTSSKRRTFCSMSGTRDLPLSRRKPVSTPR